MARRLLLCRLPRRLGLTVGLACTVSCAHADASHSRHAADKREGSSDQELIDLRRDNAALRERLAIAQDQLRLAQAKPVAKSSTPRADAPHANQLPTVRLQPPAAPVKRVHAKSLASRGGIDLESTESGLDLGPDNTVASVPTTELAQPTDATPGERPVLRWVNRDADPDPGPTGRDVAIHPHPPPRLEPGSPSVEPAKSPNVRPVTRLYEEAMRKFKGQDLAGADRLWAEVAQHYPDHDLADNAIYWRGEVAYHQGRIADALALFLQVVEVYPSGNKASDALLKQGFCYARLGESARARLVLERVVATQPGTEVAEVAARKLKELEPPAQGSP